MSGVRLSSEPFTYKEICEIIADSKLMRRPKDGQCPTAEEIFAYSPTGELFMIHEWFNTVAALELCSAGYPPMPGRS